MKVILLQDILNVGEKWDVKNVSDGYARNFLFPKKMAELVTPKVLKNLSDIKRRESEKRTGEAAAFQNSFAKLKDYHLIMNEKANEKGQLFAGVDAEKIADELLKRGFTGIKPGFIKLEKPIKKVGEYKMKAKAGDLKADFLLEIKTAE